MDYSSKNVLTEKEASALFGISASYLQKRRLASGGPTYYKVGVRVYYKKSDLESFFTGTPHNSTAEYDTACKKAARENAGAVPWLDSKKAAQA